MGLGWMVIIGQRSSKSTFGAYKRFNLTTIDGAEEIYNSIAEFPNAPGNKTVPRVEASSHHDGLPIRNPTGLRPTVK